MKLVDAEITHGDDDDESEVARPPRPEKRRVYTSLFVTTAVLVGTVVLVYAIFPPRNNEILTATIEAHREPEETELDAPTAGEVRAWAIGLFGEALPWPDDPALIPVAADRFDILRRQVALVRFRLGESEISVALMRARDVPPRVHRREDDGLAAISWRKGRYTCVAVGPAATQDRWKAAVGAP